MPTLLHTADFQIGRSYGGFDSDDAAELTAARLGAVRRIAALATDRAVDAVLVAGDVFDVQNIASKTIHRFFQALDGYHGHWIIIPGNHDAALANSVWTRARQLGLLSPNIHLFEQSGSSKFDGRNGAPGFEVLAAALTQRHTHTDLTSWFDHHPVTPGLVRIGMAHGSVTGYLPQAAGTNNPVAANRAELAALDYLALGDWHGCLQIDERTWYSGSPEPDNFRSNDAGFVLEVRIDAPGQPAQVTRHRISKYKWHREQINFSLASDVEQLANTLAAMGNTDVVRLKLSGKLDVASTSRLDKLLTSARGRLACVSLDRQALLLAPETDEVSALQADGYVGDVISSLQQEAIQMQNAPAAQRALISEALTILLSTLRDHRTAQ